MNNSQQVPQIAPSPMSGVQLDASGNKIRIDASGNKVRVGTPGHSVRIDASGNKIPTGIASGTNAVLIADANKSS